MESAERPPQIFHMIWGAVSKHHLQCECKRVFSPLPDQFIDKFTKRLNPLTFFPLKYVSTNNEDIIADAAGLVLKRKISISFTALYMKNNHALYWHRCYWINREMFFEASYLILRPPLPLSKKAQTQERLWETYIYKKKNNIQSDEQNDHIFIKIIHIYASLLLWRPLTSCRTRRNTISKIQTNRATWSNRT